MRGNSLSQNFYIYRAAVWALDRRQYFTDDYQAGIKNFMLCKVRVFVCQVVDLYGQVVGDARIEVVANYHLDFLLFG